MPIFLCWKWSFTKCDIKNGVNYLIHQYDVVIRKVRSCLFIDCKEGGELDGYGENKAVDGSR